MEVALEELIEKEDAAETDASHPCQIVRTIHMEIVDSLKMSDVAKQKVLK